MFPNKKKAPGGRIEILDGWRSLAVLFMVIFHFLWDLEIFGFLPEGTMMKPLIDLWQEAIGCAFVLLAGISCRFSRNNVRRGIRTLVCAGLVMAAGALTDQPIWFGVLHLLGCGMLLYAAVGKWFDSRATTGVTALLLVLFAVTKVISDRVRVTVPWLWIVGLPTNEFVSMDYYPLFPWLFLFFAGAAVGGRILISDGAWKHKTLPPALTWPGRHSLWIYLIHQPVLYGLVWLIAKR